MNILCPFYDPTKMDRIPLEPEVMEIYAVSSKNQNFHFNFEFFLNQRYFFIDFIVIEIFFPSSRLLLRKRFCD